MTSTETIAASEDAAKNLAEQQQWREAARRLLRAAKAEPHNTARWLQIASWQRQSGDARLAASTLQTALRLNAKNKNVEDLSLRQALIEAHLEAQNWSDGASACRALLEISPRHHFAQEMLATALLQSGNLAEAESVMRDLMSQSPRDPLHRLRLATLFQLQGKLGDSCREFERVLHLHPDFPLQNEAREAVETLDRMQTQQVLIMASEQLGFRRHLETDMAGALEVLGFYLSESGEDSLRHIISDGAPATENPIRLH